MLCAILARFLRIGGPFRIVLVRCIYGRGRIHGLQCRLNDVFAAVGSHIDRATLSEYAGLAGRDGKAGTSRDSGGAGHIVDAGVFYRFIDIDAAVRIAVLRMQVIR